MEEQIVLIINLLIFIIQPLNKLNLKPIKLNQILFLWLSNSVNKLQELIKNSLKCYKMISDLLMLKNLRLFPKLEWIENIDFSKDLTCKASKEICKFSNKKWVLINMWFKSKRWSQLIKDLLMYNLILLIKMLPILIWLIMPYG